MIDPFVLLTPFLLLGIVGLLRFVGCAAILGLDDVTYAPPAENPQNPVPSITSIEDPSSASRVVCGGQFLLVVSGSGFVDNSKVLWIDGQKVDELQAGPAAGRLFANISADKLEKLNPGAIPVAPELGQPDPVKREVTVKVRNPPPAGGDSPDFKIFTILPGLPHPVNFANAPVGPLAGPFNGLNFTAGEWSVSSRFAGGPLDIAFAAGGPATFSFANSAKRVLLSVVVLSSPNEAIEIALSDDENQTTQRFRLPIEAQAQPKTIHTGWTTCSKTISVSGSANLRILRIIYLGPLL